jgi:hypothetical protein
VRSLFVVLALVVPLTACRDSEEAACGPVTREALDPNSGLHVLPNSPRVEYSTDPPTSGAHYGLPPPRGTVDEPLPRPMQVTALEAGRVLIQYRDLSDAEVTGLAELATGEVVLAPNPRQAEPVVLTAWLTKQTCSGPELETIRTFITDYEGTGPGTDF